jgi:hypothetical protein
VFDTLRVSSLDHQKIMNGDHGPPTPLRKVLPQPIQVVARLEWHRDGEEYVNTVALAWHGDEVEVVVIDERHSGSTAWIPASDVKRR